MDKFERCLRLKKLLIQSAINGREISYGTQLDYDYYCNNVIKKRQRCDQLTKIIILHQQAEVRVPFSIRLARLYNCRKK
jgi:hypothetical protein